MKKSKKNVARKDGSLGGIQSGNLFCVRLNGESTILTPDYWRGRLAHIKDPRSEVRKESRPERARDEKGIIFSHLLKDYVQKGY